jgi:hypothetical protein
MNKLALISLLALGACTQADLMGSPEQDYMHNSVQNKVGPNGELISPESCPDWSASPYNTHGNKRQGNFSCAYVTNLGLMLEDPRDLVRGASGGHIPADPERSTRAVQRYRSGDTESQPSATAADMMGLGGAAE